MRILKTVEAQPDYRPPAGVYLTITDAVWARIEAWCRHRWGTREVIWIVDTDDQTAEFVPPLSPATFTSAKLWSPGGWRDDVEPTDTPLGKLLLPGQWQMTYQVGHGDLQPEVREAVRRYAEYMEQNGSEAGISALSDGDYSVRRSPNAIAQALQYSGAADLLRAYR